MWHWRPEKWCWKFRFDHSNKLQFTIYSEKSYIYLFLFAYYIKKQNKIHNITILLFLLYFWSNKCSLAEQKRLLSKTLKSYPLFSPSFPRGKGNHAQNVVLGCQPSLLISQQTLQNPQVTTSIFWTSTCLWMRAKLSRALFSSSSTTFGSSTVRFSLKASCTRRRAYVLQKREIKTTHLMFCICLLLTQFWESNWPEK